MGEIEVTVCLQRVSESMAIVKYRSSAGLSLTFVCCDRRGLESDTASNLVFKTKAAELVEAQQVTSCNLALTTPIFPRRQGLQELKIANHPDGLPEPSNEVLSFRQV